MPPKYHKSLFTKYNFTSDYFECPVYFIHFQTLDKTNFIYEIFTTMQEFYFYLAYQLSGSYGS
ncbi:MAG: hypothetical protein WAS28_09225, partial [Saprospiraceae bacterium]